MKTDNPRKFINEIYESQGVLITEAEQKEIKKAVDKLDKRDWIKLKIRPNE